MPCDADVLEKKWVSVENFHGVTGRVECGMVWKPWADQTTKCISITEDGSKKNQEVLGDITR
jgi:hypothetical protein